MIHEGILPRKDKLTVGTVKQTPRSTNFTANPTRCCSSTTMGRGEHDQIDPSLIITEPRVPQPTAQAQGLDQQEALGVPKIPEMFNG